MPLPINSATAQKAGYILLTSAMYHADDASTTQLICALRHNIAKEMTIPVLTETIDLIETLVYPRFSHL